MAEFDVTLSAMESAAQNISNYTQSFKEEADGVYNAAQTLSESWTGDASQTFVENMEQLHHWMDELASVLDTYSAELNTARAAYEEADVNSSKNFR